MEFHLLPNRQRMSDSVAYAPKFDDSGSKRR